MISLKKYLESAESRPIQPVNAQDDAVLPAITGAYRSALLEMGNCSIAACPALGAGLQQRLASSAERLDAPLDLQALAATEANVRDDLMNWGKDTARHYQESTAEVKGILLLMARTAESVGERDQRASQQINEVTKRLRSIANLEDLTQIRSSIERSATDLKASVDRITAEGKAAIERLRAEVSSYQARLEEAEYIASCDALTGLSSRLWTEGQLQRRIDSGAVFCAVVLDIDGFKHVNDSHGHLVGDLLLKQFALELRSACRSTDIVGRWGGDEFLVLFDCAFADASAQTGRLRKWICGEYSLKGRSGAQKIRVDVSFGLAEHIPGEALKDLLDRADAQMYENKKASRVRGG